MAIRMSDGDKVELYRAYSVEEILDRREMFSKNDSFDEFYDFYYYYSSDS